MRHHTRFLQARFHLDPSLYILHLGRCASVSGGLLWTAHAGGYQGMKLCTSVKRSPNLGRIVMSVACEKVPAHQLQCDGAENIDNVTRMSSRFSQA